MSGSQLEAAKKCVLAFKDAVREERSWEQGDYGVRAYAVSKSTLSGTKTKHLLGRWHDLPNRVIHRKDVPLMRLGDICDIFDGPSPNMATAPGEFIMVVPAEDRKTADHWDFEGKAVCIPLVSSAGHGKADIKRVHYQEGKFALASTMCALFVKDELIVYPRYLHIFLSAMCQELLVPLMCGATNVTLSSSQLGDVMIPVPTPALQEEVIESDLIATKASAMLDTAISLRESSSDKQVVQFADHVIRQTTGFLATMNSRVSITTLLPSSGHS